MTRLRTWGAEWGHLYGDAVDLGNPPSGGASVQSAVKRSGNYAYALTGTNPRITFATFGAVFDRTYYVRGYFRWTANPTGEFTLFTLDDSSGPKLKVRLTAAGRLHMFAVSGSFDEVSSGAPYDTDRWYSIEVKVRIRASGDDVEIRVGGAFAVGANGGEVSANPLTTLTIGDPAVSPAPAVVYADDFAINDDQGTLQNSWTVPDGSQSPLDCHVGLALPVADAQVGSWTGGAGGTGSLFDALDNRPPVGAAGGGNAAQIQTQANNTSGDEYRATLQSYAVAAPDVGSLVVGQAIVWHGEVVGIGIKTGGVSVLSNPAQGAFDVFTFGDDFGALDTYPTNWRLRFGTPLDLAAAATGTAPVLAVQKTSGVGTANGRSAICALGLYFEYRAADAPDDVLEGANNIYYGTIPVTAVYAGTVKDWPP